MNKIKELPINVINIIAAGQVIERPASVVKELLENSIDSGASTIKIYIKEGGLELIRVIDNGCGIDKLDLKNSIKRYCTSKISSEDDILSLKTLGFRGEALFAINEVCNLTIRSKIKDSNSGNQLSNFTDNLEIIPLGMPDGTEVIVKDLFYNLPARKNFLTNKNLEYRKILEVFTEIALSNPQISFQFFNNEKLVYNLFSENLESRVESLLGKTTLIDLVPLNYNGTYFSLHGYISRPQLYTTTRSKQFLYINNRSIRKSQISSIVKDAYGNLLDNNSYPVFILFLETNPNLIDVNVHPRKEEIKFVNERIINEQIYEAILLGLQSYDLTFIKRGYEFSNEILIADLKNASDFQILSLEVSSKDVEIDDQTEILQIHNLYLAYEYSHGLVLVDQHAAHERILYEKLISIYQNGFNSLDVTSFEVPVIFDLSLSDAELLRSNIVHFSQMGFEIEEFGQNSFRILSIPKILGDRNQTGVIAEVLDDIANDKTIRATDTVASKAISYLACRSAIKSGEFLTIEKRRNLINLLSQTSSNYTCPHGRPVIIRLSLDELGRLFKRG